MRTERLEGAARCHCTSPERASSARCGSGKIFGSSSDAFCDASSSTPRESLEPIIAALSAAGLLVKVSEKRLIPGKDPHRTGLIEIVATVRGGERNPVDPGASWSDGVDNIVDRIDDAITKELGERTLGQLVDAHLDREQAH